MTPIEIAYFKHFMYDRGIARDFLYMYRTRRVNGSPKGDKDGNPKNIEEYFLQTSREDVIMKAFVFPINNGNIREDQSYDYWKDIDDKWQTYMSDNEDNRFNESWPQLRNTFGILRQNWDVEYYWRRENFESTQEVYERMHINLPLPEKQWQHGFVYAPRKDKELLQLNINNATDGDFLVRIKNCKDSTVIRTIMLFRKLVPLQEEPGHLIAKLYAFYCIENKQLRISEEDHGNIIVNPSDSTVLFRGAFDAEKELLLNRLSCIGLRWDETAKALLPLHEETPCQLPADSMPDVDDVDFEEDDLEIDFVEIDKTTRYSNGLRNGIISVNTRSHSWKIGFNRFDTKAIKDKQAKYAMVGRTKSGDVVIQLNNNSKGVPMVYTSENYYNINSRKFVENLRNMMHITDDLVYLRIEKIAEKMDSITYKVTKQ